MDNVLNKYHLIKAAVVGLGATNELLCSIVSEITSDRMEARIAERIESFDCSKCVVIAGDNILSDKEIEQLRAIDWRSILLSKEDLQYFPPAAEEAKDG